MTLKKYIHLLPAAYFMLLGLFVLVCGVIYHTWQPTDMIYVTLLMLPILIRRQWLYGVFGMLSSIVWTFFLVAVFIWFNKEPNTQVGNHHYTTTDFVVGFVLCSVSAFFSAALLYQAFYWQHRRQTTP